MSRNRRVPLRPARPLLVITKARMRSRLGTHIFNSQHFGGLFLFVPSSRGRRRGSVVPRPSYPLFQFLGDLNDVTLCHYPLEYSQCWRIDLKSLEEAAGPKTKAAVLVNPNNPTGSFIKKDELSGLNRICQAKKCPDSFPMRSSWISPFPAARMLSVW